MSRAGLVVVALLAAAVGASLLLTRDRAASPDASAPRSQPSGRDARQPAGPNDEERVRALIRRRGRLLEEGRARALAATATAGRRPAERREAQRARRLGVRRVEVTVDALRVRDDRAGARVTLGYRLRGVPGRFAAHHRLSLVRTSRGWRVRSVAGARRRAPWEVAAFRRVPSRHFVVLAPPGIDPAAGGLLTALETGYGRMRGLLVRGRLRRRYLVVATADGAQARRITAGIRGVGTLAALTDTEVREAGRERRVAELLSQRLIVIWPNFAAAGPEGTTVVVHELTHAVLAPLTSGRTPSWLTEGVALYVSDDRRVAEAARRLAEGGREGLALAELDHPDAIGRLSGEGKSAAYAYASSAAYFIVEQYGRDRLLALYDAFNDPEVAGAGEAVRRELGISLRALDRRLRRWIALRAATAPVAP